MDKRKTLLGKGKAVKSGDGSADRKGPSLSPFEPFFFNVKSLPEIPIKDLEGQYKTDFIPILSSLGGPVTGKINGPDEFGLKRLILIAADSLLVDGQTEDTQIIYGPKTLVETIKVDGYSGTIDEFVEQYGFKKAQSTFNDLGFTLNQRDIGFCQTEIELQGLKEIIRHGDDIKSSIMSFIYPKDSRGKTKRFHKEEVLDTDPKKDCAKGLHIGNKDYFFIIKQRVITVTIPSYAHIVIPINFNGKIRSNYMKMQLRKKN